MDHFDYRNGELFGEDIALSEIAKDVGTPFYCYSSATLERHFKVFNDAVSDLGGEIFYAVKANSNIAVIATLAKLGAGADVVSSGEMRRAMAAGISPQKIIFSGVGKTRDELTEALRVGVKQINVESEPELLSLSDVAQSLGKTAEVSVRVNPDVDPGTHEKITTGKSENKFGIDLDLARDVYARAAKLPGIKLIGVALHIGSQLTNLDPYRLAYSRAVDFVRQLREDGHDICHLDLGGGLGITYDQENAPTPKAYGEMVKDVIGDLDINVAFEPGRLITGNAGVLVTEIVFVKEGINRHFCIIDGAMNDLIRPTLYDAYHSIIPVKEPNPDAELTEMDIVGPICESGDYFAKNRPMPPVQDGDLLAVRTVGAYASAMASMYNSRALAPEVLVKGDQYAVIRERVDVEDMLKFESFPTWLGGERTRRYRNGMIKNANRINPEDPVKSRVQGLLVLALAALIWEQAWPKIWSLIALFLIFISVALFDLLPELPATAHWLVLAGFGLLFLKHVRSLLRINYRVDDDQVRARLEKDSQLDHRPLRTQHDRLINGQYDPSAAHLWDAYQQRMKDEMSLLRLNMPSPGMAKKDPFALRMVILLIAVLAGWVGWNDAGQRVSRAFWPHSAEQMIAEQKLDVWVTPPSYTGLAPMFFGTTPVQVPSTEKQIKSASEAPLVPVGSAIIAHVSGIDHGLEIVLAERRVALNSIDKNEETAGYRGEASVLEEDIGVTSLVIANDGLPVFEWPIQIVGDGPPEVNFVDPPKKIGQANLALRFEARDDFSLKDIWATISKPNNDGSVRIDLPVSGLGTPDAKGISRHDYSAHPWAGTAVELRLFAEDAKGQIGKGDAFGMILPERIFNHPIARALVEQRKKLNTPNMRSVAEVVFALNQINSNPARFFHDTIVFLNIAVARSRLSHDQSLEAIVSVQKQLWETALRIEDGEFSLADRDLRDIQERLAKAIQEGGSSEQLEQLMAELQAALDKYMSALAEHLQKQGLSELPTSPSTRAMESGDLQRMIERARDMANIGDMDAAREMLAQLNRVLDNIRDGARMTPQNGQMANARKMMNTLRNLSKRQQKLLDQTYKEMQDSQNKSGQLPKLEKPGGEQPNGADRQRGPSPDDKPSSNAGAMQGMADEQQRLWRELGRMMLQMDNILGSIPGGLGEAERAMKGAGSALGQGDASGAIPDQTKALEKLKQGTNQAAEQLSKQMQGQGQGQVGLAPGQTGQRPSEGRDPFGRSAGRATGGVADDGSVKMPSERDILRTRKIIDELRRRVGEQSRPQVERDYIDRLLRRF